MCVSVPDGTLVRGVDLIFGTVEHDSNGKEIITLIWCTFQMDDCYTDIVDVALTEKVLSLGKDVHEACLQVRALKDNIYENEEPVMIFVSSTDNAAIIPNSPITITIIDLDTGTVYGCS